MQKITVIALALLLTGSIAITLQNVSGAPTLSVPEFTVTFASHSYEVPTTYHIDQYTGRNMSHQGYLVANRSFEITIKNQEYTPQVIEKSTNFGLYYNIRMKGHYGNEWITPNAYSSDSSTPAKPISRVPASNSEYTVISCAPSFYQFGDELDFQVEAALGYSYIQDVPDSIVILPGFKVIETSGWSKAQSIKIEEIWAPVMPITNTPAPTKTTTPQQNQTESTDTVQQIAHQTDLLGLEWKDIAIGLLVAVVAVFAAALVYSRTRKAPISPKG